MNTDCKDRERYNFESNEISYLYFVFLMYFNSKDRLLLRVLVSFQANNHFLQYTSNTEYMNISMSVPGVANIITSYPSSMGLFENGLYLKGAI